MRLIILFGSRARGDFTESSDFDVLIVGDEVPIDPRKVPDGALHVGCEDVPWGSRPNFHEH